MYVLHCSVDAHGNARLVSNVRCFLLVKELLEFVNNERACSFGSCFALGLYNCSQLFSDCVVMVWGLRELVEDAVESGS